MFYFRLSVSLKHEEYILRVHHHLFTYLLSNEPFQFTLPFPQCMRLLSNKLMYVFLKPTICVSIFNSTKLRHYTSLQYAFEYTHGEIIFSNFL